MSRHFDKAIAKLTSKEREAMFERGLWRALEEGIRELDAPNAHELERQLDGARDSRAAIARLLGDVCRLRSLAKENEQLKQRIEALELGDQPQARAAFGR